MRGGKHKASNANGLVGGEDRDLGTVADFSHDEGVVRVFCAPQRFANKKIKNLCSAVFFYQKISAVSPAVRNHG